QFDLMKYKGWKLANTNKKKRELIKKAIDLHRHKGTIWAIREALRTVGYDDVIITEHVTHWAGFTVQLGVSDDTPVTESEINEALSMVREYKNVRSHLLGFEFKVDLT